MKEFFKKIINWFSNIFHGNKIKAEFDRVMTELLMLREALEDIAEQKDEFEALVNKYKKQIKELKEKLKELTPKE